MTRPVALITGASSGIGRALAIEYARRGHDVVLTARRVERLQQLAAELQQHGVEALAVAGDVSVDGDLDVVVEQALERFGRLDVAVANAGIGVAAPFARLSLDDFRRVYETNVFGVFRTAKACFEALKKSRGSLVVIGSVNGFMGLPGSGAYASSKFAVKGLCESLYYEFAPLGVSVTHVAPGFIESEIRLVDNQGKLREERKDPIPKWLVMPAETAARQIVRAAARRKREVVITYHGKAAAALARHTPWLVASVVRAVGRRAVRDKS